MQELLRRYPAIPVIMITGFGSIDTAVQAMKLGALDYITKPLDIEKLLQVLDNTLNFPEVPQHASRQDGAFDEDDSRGLLQSPNMSDLYEQARTLARADFPVLITGENGTGKEVIADFIHAHSRRHAHDMLKINCAAFPEALLDNELFGHEKGAYTGAENTFKGVFERADNSTLFLDEIGDMSLMIQAKILRTLQNQEIRRIGSERTINVRFLAATNKDLRKLIREQTFREDLFYRLGVAAIHIPALREREEDIPLLANYFLAQYVRAHNSPVRCLHEEVSVRFLQHPWPGNIRELKHTIYYAAMLSKGDVITVDALPPHFRQPQMCHHAPANIREEMERNLILDMLEETNYNKRRTAELLKMSRNTLYNKLKKYGIALTK